jgi:hypothetical protein
LYDASNNKLAENDDFCNVCSKISYILTDVCQIYSIHEGCFGHRACSGIVKVTGALYIATGILLYFLLTIKNILKSTSNNNFIN